MNILITGGTGFIGCALVPYLRSQGHRLWVLTRHHKKSQDGCDYVCDLKEVQQNIDAIINLAGESLAAKRWNADFKKRLVDSRVSTTQRIGHWLDSLAAENKPLPKVLLSGSAIGFYGNRLDERLTEASTKGTGFASDLCASWEQCAKDIAKKHDLRLCVMRIGVVFAKQGGAFEQMRASFDKKVAAQLGNGQQFLSWIHRDDLVSAMLALLEHSGWIGEFNLTAPNPITNRTFTRTLATKMNSWLSIKLPGWFMKLVVGEMASELLLSGQRVVPERLIDYGFQFKYPTLESALDEMSV